MVKVVACPHCGRPVEWTEAARWRPFCSERCRLIDLGDWIEENHRISDPTDVPSDDPPPSEDGPAHH
ncbi:DNA gyrase inhibitor YacG [Thiorhodococcus mannitoliphagus]|uniref:DNA gyrase inhibitor YacG n=1 Tax=Thiorhodococcus mannitoliphagus TaxID=329406 RepID=A0A6P1DT52_9GAMM|nr:DNA gyrase inhibitor YacG [Thiorhodococcus mannitoliphagus]NEX18885.1 DNA gyrase inhibitor YacG [Thiorhodococcus mannitoliphagus]